MPSIGQYQHRESPVHSCDPRTKILAVLALSTVILNLGSSGLFAVVIIIMLLSWTARISWVMLAHSTRPMWPFFIMLFFIYLLFTPGRLIIPYSWGPVQISCEGLYLAISGVGRFLLLAAAASLLTLTTSPLELTMGMERLLRPLKMLGISSHNVALMINMALRFIPTLQQEIITVREAALARGAAFEAAGLRGKIRALLILSTPLALSILKRSDDLTDAMEARGYQPGPRTYLYELNYTRKDYWILLITAAVIAGLWLS